MTVPAGFPVADGPLIPSWPRVLWQIAWTAGGNSSAPSHWYTVSKRLRGQWKATLAGRQYELDAVQAGTAGFTLDNLDGAFDPDNTASPFYPYVLPYRRCRLVVMANPTRNLLQPWVAAGTTTLNGAGQTITSMAASAGTVTLATGITGASSGVSTALTWAIPNGAASFVRLGVNGASADWTVTGSETTTVTPGAPYALGVDVRLLPGGMTTLTMRARLSWYDLAGNNISSSVGTTVAVGTGWTRLTAAGTAPAGAMFAAVNVSTQQATTAATTVQATGWQLEQAAAATAWVSSGTWSRLWTGFVESWPQSYTGGTYGQVSVSCVDALGPLSQLVLPPAMPTWVALQNPQYRFDLAATAPSPDVPGGLAFPDLGGTGAALDITGANIITGASITSTADTGTLWNTPGPVTTLANNQAASQGNSANASYLTPWDGADHVMLPGSGGWTRLICFRTTALPGTGGRYTLATLWAATAAGFLAATADQSGAYCFINTDGHVGANIQRADGTALVTVNQLVSVCDGNWHAAAVALSADGKTCTVTVDGQGWFNTSALDQHSATYDRDTIGNLITSTTGVSTQPFNGDMAWAAQWTTALTTTAADITRGFAAGWAGDSNASRLVRMCQIAGAQLSTRFAGLTGFLGQVATDGRSPLDVLQTGADTEVGQVIIDRSGVLAVIGALWRWTQSVPLAVFGENTAAGELPYEGDITFEQDPARLFNDVQITCDGSPDATDTTRLQTATDTASQQAYFPQSLTRTINPQTVATGQAVADYLLSQYKDPHTRLSGLSVDLASDPNRLTALLDINFADLVRVVRRPALAPAKTLDCFVEQVEWSGDDTGALGLALQMSPAAQGRYWLISATWATLTTAAAAGATTLTTGPVTGNNSIPAQYVIPAGYQMILGYGTPAAETVTVASMQTVTAGYTAVQLTLTAPTASAHTAGETLCTPLPGNVLLPPGGTYPTSLDGSAAFDNALFPF